MLRHWLRMSFAAMHLSGSTARTELGVATFNSLQKTQSSGGMLRHLRQRRTNRLFPRQHQTPALRPYLPKGIGAGYTRIIANAVINEFRFSWATMGIRSVGTQARNEIIPDSLDLAVTSGTPNFNVTNISGLGGQAPCRGNSPPQKTSGVFDLLITYPGREGSISTRWVLNFFGFVRAPSQLQTGAPASALPVYSHKIHAPAERRATRPPICSWAMRTP